MPHGPVNGSSKVAKTMTSKTRTVQSPGRAIGGRQFASRPDGWVWLGMTVDRDLPDARRRYSPTQAQAHGLVTIRQVAYAAGVTQGTVRMWTNDRREGPTTWDHAFPTDVADFTDGCLHGRLYVATEVSAWLRVATANRPLVRRLARHKT